MARSTNDWIKSFMFWTKEMEAPDSYLHWTAIATVGAAIQRQISIPWVYYDFYPNMYIILVGPPGELHKSSTLNQGRKLLNLVKVPTASEAGTREALIDQMITRNAGKKNNALAAISSDLMSFIPSSTAIPIIEFLTDIFDSPDRWEYNTRKEGTKAIKNAYLSILAGTTPSWIASTFDISFIDQGFASRSIFVYEEEPRFKKARAVVTEEMTREYAKLVETLSHISKLNFAFRWTKEGEEWFDHWYEQELPQERKAADYRIKGYISRKPTHLLKLSMILSVCETDSIDMDVKYFKKARKLLDDLETSMAKTYSHVGRNIYANDSERIYQEILLSGGMSEPEIRRRNRSAMGKQVMDDTLEELQLMNLVEKSFRGKDFFYTAKPLKKKEK